MKRRVLFVLAAVLVLGAGAGGTYYDLSRSKGDETRLVLLGNVDVRQIDLAFKVDGRIARMAVEEGDRVAPGQVVASLDTRYFEDDLRVARARRDAQRANLTKLENGSRPEEIAQARANVALGQANVEVNRLTLERQAKLLKTGNA